MANANIDLDEISLMMLQLMDKVIENKKQLEETMRNGFFMIGKSRYIMGAQSVSMLQVPSNDCEVKPQVFTSVSEEQGSDEFPFVHSKFDMHSFAPNKKTSISLDEGNEDLILRKRGVTKVEVLDDEEKIYKTTNPLQWFSALPPQSLRQAQSYFKQAILLLAEIATLQSKISSLRANFKNVAV